MNTIYLSPTAPSTSSADSRVSSVTYPSPFQRIPPRPRQRSYPPFEYDNLLDPMFGSKYRRNYDRVHRSQRALGLYGGAAAPSYGVPPAGASTVGGHYPYSGAYPYAGYGGSYGAGYGAGYGQMYPSPGMGMGMGAVCDPMLGGYESDYAFRRYGSRRYRPQWGRRQMFDRYYDTDEDFYQ